MSNGVKLRVLIADDEPPARKRLADLLAREEEVEVVDAVEDGPEAVEAIRALRPDLVFLDVQMPGMSGVDVVREVGSEQMPAIIFVTAYDRYALRAFDLAALDYLLKPFDDVRFRQAFARAREQLRLRRVDAATGRLLALLPAGGAPAVPRPTPDIPPEYLERIAVEVRGKLRVIPVERIDHITSSGSYAELHVAGDTYLVRERMSNLDARLDPRRFMRIHRSAIVQLDRIETLLVRRGGVYAVQLRGGVRLQVSRRRREALQQKLGVSR